MIIPIKVRIGSNRQTVIPPEVLEALRLNPGDQLLAQVENGVIVLVSERANPVEGLKGRHRDIWSGQNIQQFVDEERDAWEASQTRCALTRSWRLFRVA